MYFLLVVVDRILERRPKNGLSIALGKRLMDQKFTPGKIELHGARHDIEMQRVDVQSPYPNNLFRAGSDCLNSFRAIAKWNPASVRLPSGLMTAH